MKTDFGQECDGGDTHLERQADLPSHQLLHGREHDRVPHLLALAVSLHLPVQSRRLASLGVSVVRPHGVHLQSGQVFFL